MKRVMMMAMGIVCLAFIVGCNSNNSPSVVARKFYAAVEKNDSKAMGEVATSKTVQTMAMFGEKASGMVKAYGEITETTEEIEGETAVVTVKFASGDTQDLDLIKVDGKWKVNIDK